jgi:Bacterial regulatory helix-turn-helix protein, lysR family
MQSGAMGRSGEAARKLEVGVAAINRQLFRFETDVGMPLFERFANGVKLTAAGEVFAAMSSPCCRLRDVSSTSWTHCADCGVAN